MLKSLHCEIVFSISSYVVNVRCRCMFVVWIIIIAVCVGIFNCRMTWGVVFQRHSLWYIVSIILLTKLKHNYIIVLSVFQMTFLCLLGLWWSKEHGLHWTPSECFSLANFYEWQRSKSLFFCFPCFAEALGNLRKLLVKHTWI